MKKLTLMQNELKVPKSQYNNFGGYNYRNCEDICEALKPLLKKYEFSLHMSDSIELIGDRYYVKAIVSLEDLEDKVIIESVGYAREAVSKKGMDESQITGAASSYARKYALNALFLLDDTKDADTTNKHGKNNTNPHTPPPKKDTPKPADQGHNTTKMDQINYISEKIMEMTNADYNDAANMLETLSQFKTIDNQTGEEKLIKGFTSFNSLVKKASEARIKVIYGLTKKEYENFKASKANQVKSFNNFARGDE